MNTEIPWLGFSALLVRAKTMNRSAMGAFVM
jgi:hypothetical protein